MRWYGIGSLSGDTRDVLWALHYDEGVVCLNMVDGSVGTDLLIRWGVLQGHTHT